MPRDCKHHASRGHAAVAVEGSDLETTHRMLGPEASRMKHHGRGTVIPPEDHAHFAHKSAGGLDAVPMVLGSHMMLKALTMGVQDEGGQRKLHLLGKPQGPAAKQSARRSPAAPSGGAGGVGGGVGSSAQTAKGGGAAGAPVREAGASSAARAGGAAPVASAAQQRHMDRRYRLRMMKQVAGQVLECRKHMAGAFKQSFAVPGAV
mmetsp:Transcript_14306/g.38051  ORF Transcript_14306/g.38051 Transcript_14306/m.38051 type:complete len:205 (+) Transcript_14306:52-666(+)